MVWRSCVNLPEKLLATARESFGVDRLPFEIPEEYPPAASKPSNKEHLQHIQVLGNEKVLCFIDDYNIELRNIDVIRKCPLKYPLGEPIGPEFSGLMIARRDSRESKQDSVECPDG